MGRNQENGFVQVGRRYQFETERARVLKPAIVEALVTRFLRPVRRASDDDLKAIAAGDLQDTTMTTRSFWKRLMPHNEASRFREVINRDKQIASLTIQIYNIRMAITAEEMASLDVRNPQEIQRLRDERKRLWNTRHQILANHSS